MLLAYQEQRLFIQYIKALWRNKKWYLVSQLVSWSSFYGGNMWIPFKLTRHIYLRMSKSSPHTITSLTNQKMKSFWQAKSLHSRKSWYMLKMTYVTSQNTVEAKILGVQQLERSFRCVSCKKKVVPDVHYNTFANCESCHLRQLVLNCSIQWYLRLLVKPLAEGSCNLHLTLFNNDVASLLDIVSWSKNSNSASQAEMEKAILMTNRAVTFTYNSMDLI